MQLNLPIVPVYDLEVKDGDLVAATHGRSFWVLDDLTPLRESASDALTGTHLFEPRPAIRFMKQLGSIVESGPGKHYASDILGDPASWIESTDSDGRTTRKGLDSGVNPPEGAAIDFRLDVAPDGEVTVEVIDAAGTVVRRFSSCGEGADKLTARPGLNRTWWDPAIHHLRRPPGRGRRREPLRRGQDRPTRLTRDLHRPGSPSGSPSSPAPPRSKSSWTRARTPPRPTSTHSSPSSLRIRDKYEETRDRVLTIRAIKDQLDEWEKRGRRRRG